MASLVSVNVGRPREISSRRGKPLMSAIWKAPVEGRVRVEGVNLAGDDQADRSVHGGPEKAVYAYAREDIDWWENIHGDLPNGVFGENLTTLGLDVSGALLGERWRIGTVVLEVCQPRLPCSKLGIRFNDLRMVKAFAKASRPGAYMRIVEEGELGAGDEIEVVSIPDHGVTLAFAADACLKDRSLAPAVLAVPGLSHELRAELLEAA
ncbi:MOSC domain-containing protein [Solirubrobacter soli]|uniref:MOSC domain-containing protein n=1 Tax=Solirubrobacter soli TaxID=363832 RepID=UPI000416F275|nr:MOSC domain-containing protein [Solirubrobacter soli]